MGGFDRSSKLLFVALWLAFGCQDRLANLQGTESIRIEMISPSELGSEQEPLVPGPRTFTFNLRAYDINGDFDASLSGPIQVYVHYQGSRSLPVNLEPDPTLAPRWRMLNQPVDTVDMVDGVAEGVTVEVPAVYGPTLIWAEHHLETGVEGDRSQTHALGTSETIWFENPTVRTLSAPISEAGGIEVFFSSAMTDKQATITGSRHGAEGHLVVTATYQDGYTVSDVHCGEQDGVTSCTTEEYDHVFVFSHSRGEYEEGGRVEVGHTLSFLGGSVAEFNGLMEVNFPRAHYASKTPRLELLPPPVPVQKEWFSDPILLEQQEGAVVEGVGEICKLSDNDRDRGQFSVNVGAGCGFGKALVVVSGVTAASFDAAANEGKNVRVLGTLRPVQTFSGPPANNFFQIWLTHPRNISDIEVLP